MTGGISQVMLLGEFGGCSAAEFGMRPDRIVQAGETTPMLPKNAKFYIDGIHGLGCRCMSTSLLIDGRRRFSVAALMD